MHPVSVHGAPPRTPGFLLTLAGLADEVCATLARLIAYVGALALIAMLALILWQRAGNVDAAVLSSRSAWSADGPVPAFTLRLTDQLDKSATYTVLRYPAGGRKDIFRWGKPSQRPALVELELYRLGDEADAATDPASNLAMRMAVDGPDALEPAGVIDSKFGPFGLMRQTGAHEGVGACLGFLKSVSVPALRISGWTCQGAGVASRRTAIGCMLNRLTLLSAGSEPGIADWFVGAESRRRACDLTASGGSFDWATTAGNPQLRGTL